MIFILAMRSVDEFIFLTPHLPKKYLAAMYFNRNENNTFRLAKQFYEKYNIIIPKKKLAYYYFINCNFSNDLL